MKTYQKEIEGKVVKKTLNEIILSCDGRMIYNPTEDMVLADGWTEYVIQPKEIPMDIRIRIAKDRKVRELYIYDESSDVNDCIIVCQGNELHYWASKTERNDLKNAVRDCLSVYKYTYRLDLRDKGISITLPCELLLQMLASLEVYAIECYNKTTDHNYAIKALETLEDVEAYDYKVGYPEKLRFEV